MAFTRRERRTLLRLLAENSTDVIVKTDRGGFMVQTVPDVERLGLRLPGGPIGRHLLDLVHPSRAAEVRAAHDAAIAGRLERGWVEFPAVTEDGAARWYQIQSRPLASEREGIYGAVSIVRSIAERKSFEEQLFAATMTDPLTGLTNRGAFVAMLRHLIDKRIGGCLAMFDIDHFKAINLRYGSTSGDQILIAFAGLLRTLTRSDDIVSRIGGESFGVLFPAASPDHAEAVGRQVVAILAETGGVAEADALPITVSGGVAAITGSLDAALKAAELGLAVAKAKGRNRLEVGESKLRLCG